MLLAAGADNGGPGELVHISFGQVTVSSAHKPSPALRSAPASAVEVLLTIQWAELFGSPDDLERVLDS